METEYSSGIRRLIVSAIVLVIGLVGAYIYNYNYLYQKLNVKFTKIETIEYGNGNYSARELIDKVDGEELVIKKDIDPTVIGKQEIVVEVKTDEVVKEFTYQVEVKDTQAPTIQIKEETVTLELGTEYNVLDNIESVVDTIDGNINYKETTEGVEYYTYSTNLDLSNPGTYDITITAVDKNNNRSETTYKVVINEKPIEQPTQPTVTKPVEEYQNDKVPVIDASSISSVAYSLVGSPYKSGGNTPAGFDCSGFVQYVYSVMGVSVSRNSKTQILDGVAVSVDNMQPGDIIIWSSNGSTPTHSSVYVGGGMMIHATNPRQGVIASNVWAWNAASRDVIIAVRRI